MNDLKWFSPENLRDQENSEEAQFDRQGDCFSTSDFRSYINLNKKNISEDIHSHNLQSRDALFVATVIYRKVKKMSPLKNILELGCGAGFSSVGIRDVFRSSRIKAIDISHNAIEYAKRTFDSIDFEVHGVDECSQVPGAPFDLIIAYEFYPFSRTNDWKYQRGIIMQLLKNGSALYIANVCDDTSIFKNMVLIENDPELRLVHYITFPKSKIYRLIPSILLSGLITKIFCLITKRRYASQMIIMSSGHNVTPV